MQFLANHHIVAAVAVAGDPRFDVFAERAGDWLSLKAYDRVCFFIVSDAWPDGNCPVTLEQAQDVSGLNAKGLTYSGFWTSPNYAAGVLPAWVETAAGQLTIAIADAPANHAYVIEATAPMLDVDNVFDCIRIVFADTKQWAYLECAAILCDPRYGGEENTVLDPLIN